MSSPRASTARAASMASLVLSPAMKRLAKLDGRRMPYRDASVLNGVMSARRWNSPFDALSSISPGSVSNGGRRQQMLDCAGVVAQNGAIANAEPAALTHDDAAGLEGIGRFIDGVAAAGDAEVRLPGAELVEQAINACFELATGDRWA